MAAGRRPGREARADAPDLVGLTYATLAVEPAGSVKTGTFVEGKPSEAEVQRREKVKLEG